MTEVHYQDEEALASLVSEEFSDWSEPIVVTQAMINQFAELTGDKLWIHVDPERCGAESPFKSTIAHGFLILSLLPKMPCGEDVTRRLQGYRQVMNYGSDKLRFLAPVPSGSRIRARNRVKSVEVSERKTKLALETQVGIESTDKTALTYDLAIIFM